MANELKSASIAHAPFAWETVYTCPVGKSAVVISAIGSNTAETNQTQGVSLAKNVSGTRTTLAQNIGVTTSSSVALLPAKLALSAGESIDARINSLSYQSRFQRGFQSTILPNSLTFLLTNGTNTLIAVFEASSNGIWRSTDGGDTWSQVNTTATLTAIGARIGTDLFVYTGATSALRSTDGGATWAVQAVTNAPTIQINRQGSIVKNGGTYAGLFSPTVMSTTTDGITWTTTTAMPQGCAALTFSGTHYIAGRNGTACDVYRSTDGTSWATVSLATQLVGTGIYATYGGLVSNGTGVVVVARNDAAVCAYSTDNGATWTRSNGAAQASSGQLYWTGSVFVAQGSTASVTSSDGVTWSTFSSAEAVGGGTPVGFTASQVVAFVSGGIRYTSTSLSMPAQYSGAAVTISVMEVA